MTKTCKDCKYLKNVYSYIYPLCTFNSNEPFQVHNINILKCDNLEEK